jgi:Family of unknown function (DUF6152)
MKRVLCVLLACSIPAVAHHSFGAEYDADKPVTVSGVVPKIEWTNPHSYFYLDVTRNGKVNNWKFEGYPPGVLMARAVAGKRAGYSKVWENV